MTPYEKYLGDRDPVEVIASTSSRLRDYVEALGAQVSTAPAPGKWSVREIVAHLADCELAFGFRLRQALAEDDYLAQPFDQEKWASTYAAYDAMLAMETFASLRHWNVRLIKSLDATAMAKPFRHPEHGQMTVRTIVETLGGHDINHLQQVEAIGAKFAAGK